MEEFRKAGEPFHFMSPFNIALSIALTAAIVFATTFLKDGQFDYVYDLIHRRGPAMYFLYVLTFSVAIPVAIQRRRKQPASTRSLLVLCFASLTPFLVGLVGTIQALGATNSSYKDMLPSVSTLEELVSAASEHAVAQATALDMAFLGLVVTLMLLFPCMCLLGQNKECPTSR